MKKTASRFVFTAIFLLGVMIMLGAFASATITTTLNSPADGSTSYTFNTTFNATLSSSLNKLNNATLWTNSTGSWTANQTINLTSRGNFTYDPGISMSTCGTNCENLVYQVGVNITVLQPGNLTSVTTAGGNIDTVYVYWSNNTLITSSGISSNIATFNLPLVVGQSYFVLGGRVSNYDRGAGSGLPVNTGSLNFTNGIRRNGAVITSEGASILAIKSINLSQDNSPTSTDALFNFTLSGRTTKWNVQTCDNSSACSFALSNYTILLDNQAPAISISSPTPIVNYGSIGGNLTLNFTATDTNLASCWYNYNFTNYTIAGCQSGVYNISNFTLTSQKNLTVWANDTAGNINSSTVNWDYNLLSNSQSYNATTISTSNELFAINISYNSSNWLGISATLVYNGTSYTSTKTGSGDNLLFSNTIQVPNTLTSTTYNFYWNFSLTNATSTYYYQTEINNQTVNPLQNITIVSNTNSCSAGFTPAFFFSFANESNLVSMTEGTVNYNFQYGQALNTALSTYGNLTNVNNFTICINATSTYYLGYGEVDYSSTGYTPRKFYLFNNTRLTNQTINNTLYNLDSGSTTTFQITATGTNLIPYANNYVGLLRWYPNLNQYSTVDMGKTDSNGQTVLNVVTNSVDYRLALYAGDGTLVQLLNPIRMVCQTTPCTYSILVSGEQPDLTNYLNIQSNLSFDSTNKIFTFIWNDPSQSTKQMSLVVYQVYGDKPEVTICNQTATGFTGILVCDIHTASGQVRAEAYRSASPTKPFAVLSEDLRRALGSLANGGSLGLFFGVILVIFMATVGLYSPQGVVLLSIIALIPMVLLGNLTLAIFMIIGAMGGLILYMLRRNTGQ